MDEFGEIRPVPEIGTLLTDEEVDDEEEKAAGAVALKSAERERCNNRLANNVDDDDDEDNDDENEDEVGEFNPFSERVCASMDIDILLPPKNRRRELRGETGTEAISILGVGCATPLAAGAGAGEGTGWTRGVMREDEDGKEEAEEDEEKVREPRRCMTCVVVNRFNTGGCC